MASARSVDTERLPVTVRISEQAQIRLKGDAHDLGLPVGHYLEMLILERGVTHTDYFAQHAAIQSFIAAGLLVGVVAQQAGPERALEIQKQASEAATGLFGAVRRRPPAIGDNPPDMDPRILALFAAFGAA